MNFEKTLVIIKPGVAERGIVGDIMSRFERKGIRILASSCIQFDKKLADQHYQEHLDKPFYPELCAYICSAPSLLFVMGGQDVIATIRRLCGATRVEDALPGTIRGDYAITTTENIIHASDSPDGAEREIALFFSDSQIMGGQEKKN